MVAEWKVNEILRRALRNLRQAKKLLTDERLSIYRFNTHFVVKIQDELYEIEDAFESVRSRTDDFDREFMDEVTDGR